LFTRPPQNYNAQSQTPCYLPVQKIPTGMVKITGREKADVAVG
jgi:hypothetical protein